jgi:hypothetical protein
MLASGYWLLVSGYWFLATGFWILVSGYWFLISDFYILSVFPEFLNLIFLTMIRGTGSMPPEPQGWQLEMRLTAIQLPRRGPCIFKACIAYSEQLGMCRHEAGVRGEMANL